MKQLSVILLLVALLVACSQQPLSRSELNTQATGSWATLGGSVSGASSTALAPSLTLFNGQPVSAYSFGNKIIVKQWQSSSWQTIVSLRVNASRTAVTPDIVANSSSIFVTWMEYLAPNTANIYVQQRTGTTWTRLSWNINSDGKLARQPAIALDASGTPFVVFVQNKEPEVADELYVKMWNGVTWQTLGSNLKVNSLGLARNPKIVVDKNGYPLVAWNEQVSVQSRGFETYVKRWNGSGWQLLAGLQNAYQLEDLAVDSQGTPYLAYISGAYLSQYYVPELYLVRWNGTAWKLVGTDFINSNGYGAFHASLTLDKANRPIIVYGQATVYGPETNPALTTSFAFVKRWLGNGWQNLGAGHLNRYLNREADSRISFSGITADANGLPYVVWEESKANLNHVYVDKFVP